MHCCKHHRAGLGGCHKYRGNHSHTKFLWTGSQQQWWQPSHDIYFLNPLPSCKTTQLCVQYKYAFAQYAICMFANCDLTTQYTTWRSIHLWSEIYICKLYSHFHNFVKIAQTQNPACDRGPLPNKPPQPSITVDTMISASYLAISRLLASAAAQRQLGASCVLWNCLEMLKTIRQYAPVTPPDCR